MAEVRNRVLARRVAIVSKDGFPQSRMNPGTEDGPLFAIDSEPVKREERAGDLWERHDIPSERIGPSRIRKLERPSDAHM
jgi:hypothetical protein